MLKLWIFFWLKLGTGLGFSRGGVHGKMVFLEQIVLFHQNGTGLTIFKWRIRLEAFSTFLHFIFNEQLVDLVVSSSTIVLLFRFLLILLKETLLFLLEIGTLVITRLVRVWRIEFIYEKVSASVLDWIRFDDDWISQCFVLINAGFEKGSRWRKRSWHAGWCSHKWKRPF